MTVSMTKPQLKKLKLSAYEYAELKFK